MAGNSTSKVSQRETRLRPGFLSRISREPCEAKAGTGSLIIVILVATVCPYFIKVLGPPSIQVPGSMGGRWLEMLVRRMNTASEPSDGQIWVQEQFFLGLRDLRSSQTMSKHERLKLDCSLLTFGRRWLVPVVAQNDAVRLSSGMFAPVNPSSKQSPCTRVISSFFFLNLECHR